ncbi:putative transcriptional regulatory protein [uncultured Pleomorphomonas sp.]|uniref:Putative transcriptional regulatory protein n=1 Tax=uncultured Pleomorphomonas sp. TaxID=442121 RepID=A0A212L3R1_9HYPH|nr:helix-turn-helix transcriptional regulator [uncultured Pleomorphomonas sp.]SCM72146.1 putative transcriptional regulatory protein [uncultured Pleomorphomonas sp.]
MDAPLTDGNALGAFLRDRRCRLDAAAFGLPMTRRRTPGLRREEVAQRANVSVTWYTWLEQGRGGAPSADVLDRIARALMLTDVEREHLFLLGLGRLPEVHYRESDGVSPRLQRVLDALELSPAIIKTATWDIIAWNRAAAVVLGDYGARPPRERNVLRMMFCDPAVRARQLDWESVARFVVATFRADAVRAGAAGNVEAMVNELSRASPEFAAMWREKEVGHHGEGTKLLRHPTLGLMSLEYSAFAVDGRPDLSMVIYNPATPEVAAEVKRLIEAADKTVRQ